ncbi:MAG: NADH:flavin oxidoreductase/NADH oxidase family protein [Polyangiaceae bacterium]
MTSFEGNVATSTGVDLRSPLRLPCGVVLPNRILKSAMTEGLADERDRPTPQHAALYRRWSEGGTGTLVTGNVMVDRRYLERPGNVVLDGEADDALLSAWAEAGVTAGNQLWMQINHPGRQCTRFVASKPVAPSAIQLEMGGLFGRPRALAEDEILDIVGRFAQTARAAQRTGFTGVQVHAAHGYLCSQFLSPRTNVRTDRWGGTLENRALFLREVVRAVRREVGPSFPVAVKLNSADFQKGGFSLEESCQVAAWLVEDGIDLLEISGGTYEQMTNFGVGHDSTISREAYFLDSAAALRSAVRVPLAITGGFRSRAAMSDALQKGELDVIGIARPLCTDPSLSRKLLEGTVADGRSDERHHRLGRGFFGPASGIAAIRGINAQAQTAWFYQQILHLAAGQEPDLGLSVSSALGGHLRRELGLSRARNAHAKRFMA